MVDPIKGCTEINLHYPSFLPTLQCTLQCMGHAPKCVTGTQTFLISKLSGWRHTTDEQTRRTDTFLTILMPWKSVGNWQKRRMVDLSEFGVTLACLQQDRKLPRRTSGRNTKQAKSSRRKGNKSFI